MSRNVVELPQEKIWKAVQQIFNHWDIPLSKRRMLLGVYKDVYESWVRAGKIGNHKWAIKNANDILMLYVELTKFFGWDNRTLAHQWIKSPNNASLFYGRTPLDTIVEDGHLDKEIVRRIIAYVQTHMNH